MRARRVPIAALKWRRVSLRGNGQTAPPEESTAAGQAARSNVRSDLTDASRLVRYKVFPATAFRKASCQLWVDFSRMRPLTRCGLHVRSSARSRNRHRSCPRCAQKRQLATFLSSQRRTALPVINGSWRAAALAQPNEPLEHVPKYADELGANGGRFRLGQAVDAAAAR